MAENTKYETQDPPADVSSSRPELLHPLWLALGGLGFVLLSSGWWVIYETLGIFATGSVEWVDCVRGTEATLSACGQELDLVYEYRFGLDALRALGAGLLAAVVGPVPMVLMLRRFQSSLASVLLFLLIALSYGLVSFLILVLGAFIIIFYGLELV